MDPLREQLELLKRRIAGIDRKYAGRAATPPAPLPEGREAMTPRGVHWQFERVWAAHERHGTADVGALSELGADLLAVLSPADGEWASPVERWVFLDTETSGLAGGSGTVAFLVGAGAATGRGFELKQFFMREHGEEASMLEALEAWLESFEVVVTYNGKAFDVPLLETRFKMNRMKPPFERLRHVDLLHSARRIYRLALESCRLQELEARILGVERHGDPGGAAIPELYFEFLRTKNFRPLWPVFTHNAIDILSLACLTAIVPSAFRDPSKLTNGAEMAGLARWLRQEGRIEDALALMRSALRRPMAEPLVWETLWHAAELERKLGNKDAAVELWTELTTAMNPFRAQAYERLAIHFEHTAKNQPMALEMTRAALEIATSETLLKREARLVAKLSRPKPDRLL